MSDTISQIENKSDDQKEIQEDILKELNLDKSEDNLESNQLMKNPSPSKILIAFSIIAVVAGIGTGFSIHKLTAKGPAVSTGPADSNLQQVAGETIKAGDIFGIKDDDTFKDSAEGYLVEADIDDEGSHKLLRPGGVSQTVFLTSSSTDLDKFVGMEIKVKGETFKGQKAGWLMDVGQVEILIVEGEEPSEY